jgi:PEP-CTERM motif
MNRPLRMLTAMAMLLGLASQASADTTYDTTPEWVGGSISAFGNPDTATYGQTFVSPTDNVLNDFTFFILGDPGIHLQMTAMVFNWTGPLQGNGGMATGPALFQSASFGLDTDGTFQTVTTTTGGVTLTPGSNYVALLTVSDPVDYSQTTGTVDWGFLPFFTHGANNGGGGFVFFNNENNFGALNTQTWDTFSDFGDAAWTAHFSGRSVPEPSSLALIGLGGLVAFRTLRRKAAKV